MADVRRAEGKVCHCPKCTKAREAPPALSKGESDRRFADLKAAGCHPKRVRLPNGDTAVVRDKACKCPQCSPPVGEPREPSPGARHASPAPALDASEADGRMRWRSDVGKDEAVSETEFGVYLVRRPPLASSHQGYQLFWFPSSTPTRAHHLGFFPTMPAAKRAARAHLDSMQTPPPPAQQAPAVVPARARALGTTGARERGTRDPDPYAEVRRRLREQGPIVRPEDAAWILAPIAESEVQEVACVLSLNVHSVGIGVREIARGGIEHVDMVIPLAIRSVAMDGSLWGILAHNHPSGEARPSPADLALWRSAREQFACAGMTLCDHLVLGKGEFFSCLWASRWRFGGGRS